eukprot:1045312-Rhodomonas_salina.1
MAHCSSPPGCQHPCWALALRPGPPSAGPSCEGSHVLPATCWTNAPATGARSRASGPPPLSVVLDSVGFSSLPCCSPPAQSVHCSPSCPCRASRLPASPLQCVAVYRNSTFPSGPGASQLPYARRSCFRTHSVPRGCSHTQLDYPLVLAVWDAQHSEVVVPSLLIQRGLPPNNHGEVLEVPLWAPRCSQTMNEVVAGRGILGLLGLRFALHSIHVVIHLQRTLTATVAAARFSAKPSGVSRLCVTSLGKGSPLWRKG